MSKNNKCCGNGRNQMARQAIFGGNNSLLNSPVASFTTPSVLGPAPLTIPFTDTSTNTPTSWLWTIIGGTLGVDYVFTVGSAISQNPTIRFDTFGYYTITLKVTNAAGNNTTSPLTITAEVAGLIGDYNWEAVNVTKDGSNFISSTMDLSVSAKNIVQATGANQPLWEASILNGHPVATFGLLLTFLKNLSFTISQPFTIIIVGKNTSIGSCMLSGGPADVEFLRFTVALADSYTIYAGGLVNQVGADNNFHIMTGIFNGAGSLVYLDGAAGTVGNAGTDGCSAIYVGNYQGAAEQMIGSLAAIKIYNHALTAAEESFIRLPLKSYYATP